MISALFILLSSFAYAVRGGLFAPGNFAGWVIWALFCGLVTFSYTANYNLALLVLVGSYSGKFLSHGRYFAITFKPDNGKQDWLGFGLPDWPETPRNILAMSYIGFVRAALIGAAIGGLAYAPMAGVFHGLLYWLAAKLVEWRLVGAGYQIMAAEFLVGALFGAYLVFLLA